MEVLKGVMKKCNVGVSLFLTTYNWPDALEACVKSVFNQIVLPNEIIIADDGSTNKTKDLVKRLQQISSVPIIHLWQEDCGFRLNLIRNAAIKSALFPYIIQIDGDMILDKYFIQDHVEHAKIGRALFGTRIELNQALTSEFCNDPNKILEPTRCRNKFLAWIRHVLIYRNRTPKGVNGCNMSYWKKDAIAVNGFDEDMQSKGPNDKDFAARLIHLGIKSYYIKFIGNGYHLTHSEEGRRPDYEVVKMIYSDTLRTKKIRCKNGIEKDL